MITHVKKPSTLKLCFCPLERKRITFKIEISIRKSVSASLAAIFKIVIYFYNNVCFIVLLTQNCYKRIKKNTEYFYVVFIF